MPGGWFWGAERGRRSGWSEVAGRRRIGREIHRGIKLAVEIPLYIYRSVNWNGMASYTEGYRMRWWRSNYHKFRVYIRSYQPSNKKTLLLFSFYILKHVLVVIANVKCTVARTSSRSGIESCDKENHAIGTTYIIPCTANKHFSKLNYTRT